MSGLAERLVDLARDAGLDHVGVCDAAPFERARDALERRRAEGLHGGMAFTYRNPARSTDPSATVPDAASLVVGALRYRTDVPAPPSPTSGAVARYATADHYRALRDALGVVRDELRSLGHRALVAADDNALVDRAAAVRAGLGWYGKSSNVLLPGEGSWFVLGSVITDAALQPSATPLEDGCGTCTRCLDGCPTGAIVAPGVVDARRCLAWLLQAEQDLPEQYREALGTRIYGCDECQEVCPPARRSAAREDGPTPEGDDGAWVELTWMLEADDEQLMERCGRWYVPRRDPRYLRRNALVALANAAATAAPGAVDTAVIDRCIAAQLDSGDDMLVRHAEWAARRAGRPELLGEHRSARTPRVGGEPGDAAQMAVRTRTEETG